MIGGIVVVAVTILLGIFAYHNTVRGVISLNEFSQEQIDRGVEIYMSWVNKNTRHLAYGTKLLYLSEYSMKLLSQTMDIEFASAISRHTRYKLFVYRDGSAKLRIEM